MILAEMTKEIAMTECHHHWSQWVKVREEIAIILSSDNIVEYHKHNCILAFVIKDFKASSGLSLIAKYEK